MASFSTTAFDSVNAFSITAWDFGAGPPPPSPSAGSMGGGGGGFNKRHEDPFWEKIELEMREILSPAPPKSPAILPVVDAVRLASTITGIKGTLRLRRAKTWAPAPAPRGDEDDDDDTPLRLLLLS